MLTRRQESTLSRSQPSSSNSQQKPEEATRIQGEKGEATESGILMGIQESNENKSSSIIEQRVLRCKDLNSTGARGI